MSCTDEIRPCFEELIGKGEHLIDVLSKPPLSSIDGVTKLKRKVKQEVTFLVKVLQNGLYKKEHVLCSNLHHLEAVVNKIQDQPNIVEIQKTFTFSDSSTELKKLSVDIVTDNGTRWVKIKSRNPKAITQIAAGDSSFGQKSMIDQAVEYLKCAEQNPAMFRPPKICIHFANGVESVLSEILVKMNIDVSGNILKKNEDQSFNLDGLHENTTALDDFLLESQKRAANLISDMQKLNLDVSTMIAFVSSLTNGGNHCHFKDPLLAQQAEWERQRPVKPILEELFQGKQLIACENAIDDFRSIVQTLGGTEEKERAQDLIQRIQTVPNNPTEKAKALTTGGKIKNRSINIFGTGDFHGAMTITANSGFIRSAKSQGTDFVAYIHESRALTEMKQMPIEPEK